MAKTTAQKIGKYEIMEKIGEGGFGIVFKANDTSLDRTVALKQLKLEFAASPEYLERFRQESRLMGSMSHPNIMKILEVVEENGRYFLVMDYMSNGSLADRLVAGEPLSLKETLNILEPIAKAIDYAHSKHLIHRDIKPSNILFMEDDDPVISDFGLVKIMDTRGLSTTGVSLGTPEYMAPEQILCRELTTAVDVYALGVVAFHMLSGALPFSGNTPFEVQEGHVHKDLPDIVSLNPHLPAEFSAVFEKALHKEPEQRYASAKDFLHDLDIVTRKQSEQEIAEKLQQAQASYQEKDFSAAAAILKEVLAIQPDEEVKEQLKECLRREKVWKSYQNLEDQKEDLSKKISEMEEHHTWICGGDDNRFTSHQNISDGEKADDAYPEGKILLWFFLFIIFLVIVIPK